MAPPLMTAKVPSGMYRRERAKLQGNQEISAKSAITQSASPTKQSSKTLLIHNRELIHAPTYPQLKCIFFEKIAKKYILAAQHVVKIVYMTP
ncbi:MAG: hypothetical protein MPL62_16995 [Alphaproteobacteria bacterium]|nr:hypothetical protein [Alphaproteobacteria bacterium]